MVLIGNSQSDVSGEHPQPASPRRVRGVGMLDLLAMAGLCLLLFGYSAISGRPLSLHEARLPQTSREMMQTGDWLFPRSGGRPWLERPPLPHWFTVGFNAMVGQKCDTVWSVRLPAALAGMITVLLTAWIAGRCFGRWEGIGAGVILATMYEFYAYASLAEDDIFLAALVAATMACFVAAQNRDERARDARDPGILATLLGSRPWPVTGFFFFLGLSNFAKGFMVGPTVVLATCGVFLIFQGWHAMRTYAWAWGWILFAAMLVSWPAVVLRRYPDMWANWFYDYHGTSLFNQPFWYYGPILLLATLPWTVPLIFGFITTAHRARSHRASPQRFIWCWTILPLIVLSIPHRKHHHYFLPSLAPWAIMAATGLMPLARTMFKGKEWSRNPLFGLLAIGLPGALALIILQSRIPGPTWATIGLAAVWVACVGAFYVGLWRQRAELLVMSMAFGIGVAYSWGQTCIPDQVVEDTRFLQNADAQVPADGLLLINAGLEGEMDFFRHAFYVRPTARILHNLTFLRDENLPAGTVYLITRQSDRQQLAAYGKAEALRVSKKTRREKSPEDRFTLFRVELSPDLKRYPAPPVDSITTMQGMGREQGPWCGPR